MWSVQSRRIFVADAGVPGVIAVDRRGQQRLIASGENFASPVAIDLAPGPRLFVADAFGIQDRDGSIISVNPANGSQSLVASGVINEREDLVEPSGIVVSQPTAFSRATRDPDRTCSTTPPGSRSTAAGTSSSATPPWCRTAAGS